jgi:uncharacterized membrane protein
MPVVAVAAIVQVATGMAIVSHIMAVVMAAVVLMGVVALIALVAMVAVVASIGQRDRTDRQQQSKQQYRYQTFHICFSIWLNTAVVCTQGAESGLNPK